MGTARPAAALLTPLVAVGGTLAGVLVLFFGQRWLAPALLGGPGAVCTAPDCALGVGVWLIVGGFVVLCASLISSVVLVLRGPSPRPVRRGLIVCLWCLLVYFLESIVLWISV